jgi:hypothetical protein
MPTCANPTPVRSARLKRMPPISRRRLLASFGLATAGVLGVAGAGAAIAALSDLPERTKAGAPGSISTAADPPTESAAGRAEVAALTIALVREQHLIATLTSAVATASVDPRAALLPSLLADHRAHASAISALIATPQSAPGPTASGASSAPTGTSPPTVDELRAAEQAALTSAAAQSATVRSAAAVLLASIAACEAGHVELIS